jgi:hypothetical protein
MVDGSVRFIKDTIDTWAFNPATGMPLGVTRDQSVWIVAQAPRSASGRRWPQSTEVRSSALKPIETMRCQRARELLLGLIPVFCSIATYSRARVSGARREPGGS